MVAFWGGFSDEEFSGFQKGEEFAIGDEEEAVLHAACAPEWFAGGWVDAADLGALFLPSVDSVEVAFVVDRSSEMTVQDAFLLPRFF